MANFSSSSWIRGAIAAGCWGLFLAFCGAAVPALRGGVIILYLLAIAASVLSGLFIETTATEQDSLYLAPGDRIVAALLPGILIAIIIVLIGGWGVWIAVH